jgi:hypothetical protein
MIRCLGYRPCVRGTLLGFADIQLSTIGLLIHDCCHHQKGGREWLNFPARSYQDMHGRTQWAAILEFAPGAKAAREQFQRLALAAIHDVTGGEPEGAS